MTTNYLLDPFCLTGNAQVVYETISGSTALNRELSHTFSYGLELVNEARSYVINGQSANSMIYFDYDGHGSVRALTDQNGSVSDTYDYDAFGNLIHQTGSTPNNYLYSGEQFDPDLGLYYNRARYLNTSTGRLWSMDSDEGKDEEPLSLHKYLFAEGDPVDNVDPTGNQIDEVLGSLGISQTLTSMSIHNFNPRTYTWRLASTISQRGVDFIKLHERLIRHPYDDGGKDKTTGKGIGNCTIGYGHLLHYDPCTDDDKAAYPSGMERHFSLQPPALLAANPKRSPTLMGSRPVAAERAALLRRGGVTRHP